MGSSIFSPRLSPRRPVLRPHNRPPPNAGAIGEGSHFACPEQPHLKLPLSRVGDGICDCCDGADRASSSPRANRGDVCDEVLAEERAARAKARSNYELGSGVDLLMAEKDLGELEGGLVDAKAALARDWLRGVNVETLGKKPLKDLLGVGSGMDAEDPASFVLSLCALSEELAVDNVANHRCVAFDRASLLWDYANGEEDEAEKEDPGPTANEILVKSLLDRVPFDRTPFKEQSKLLLKFTLGTMDDKGVFRMVGASVEIGFIGLLN